MFRLTVPGDRVRVLLDEPRGDGIAARLLDLLEPGPDRAEPPCPHFGVCGGCALQHLTDAGLWRLEACTGGDGAGARRA